MRKTTALLTLAALLVLSFTGSVCPAAPSGYWKLVETIVEESGSAHGTATNPDSYLSISGDGYSSLGVRINESFSGNGYYRLSTNYSWTPGPATLTPGQNFTMQLSARRTEASTTKVFTGSGTVEAEFERHGVSSSMDYSSRKLGSADVDWDEIASDSSTETEVVPDYGYADSETSGKMDLIIRIVAGSNNLYLRYIKYVYQWVDAGADAGGSSSDGALFSDSFSGSTLSSTWKVVDDPYPSGGPSEWYVADGQLNQDSNIYRSDDEYAYYQGSHIYADVPAFTDFNFEFDLTPDDDDGVGAIFRYQDQNNYYRFLMVDDTGNEGPFRRLDKVVAGKVTILTSETVGFDYEPIHYQISAVGSQLTVQAGGQTILTASDASLTSGKIGFMTYACMLLVDNVRVTPAQAAAPNLQPTPTPIPTPTPTPNADALPGTGSGYVSLTWPASSTVNGQSPYGYYLYRSLIPGSFDLNYPLTDFPVTDRVYQDEGLTPGKTYYYRIVPVYPDNSTGSPIDQNAVASAPAVKVSTVLVLKLNSKSALVQGTEVPLDIAPFLESGRTMVPLRFIGEKLGAAIAYDAATQKITYTKGNTTIVLWLNQKDAQINGQTVPLDVPPKVLSGRTVVPLRFVSTALGATTNWDGIKGEITITAAN